MGQATEERVTPSRISDTRESLSRDVDALYDKVSPGRVVDRRKQAVRGRFASLKDSVMGSSHHAAHRASGTVHDAASTAASTASDTAHSGAEHVRGAPLAAGLTAFSAGMVIAALIPASETEEQAAQRLTGAVKDSPALDEAKSAGREVGENLKESATHAVEEVKSSAQDGAAHVQDEGRSATQAVKDDAGGT